MLIPTWSWHTSLRVAEGNIFQHSKGHSIWKLGTQLIISYIPDSANSHSSVFISKQTFVGFNNICRLWHIILADFRKQTRNCKSQVDAGKTTRHLGATLLQSKFHKYKSQVVAGKTTRHFGATLLRSKFHNYKFQVAAG